MILARYAPVLLASLVAVACGGGAEEAAAPAAPVAPAAPNPPSSIVVDLEAKSGSTLAGTATFEAGDDGVTLTLELRGAPPGPHAVHLHEVGDCSADDATSAGGHWNPTHADHGEWGTDAFHLGDIGNVEVGADGAATHTFTTDLWTMGDGGPNDIVGRAIIVHADPDDMTTQPTGAAGGRIGCGVID